MNQDSLRDVEKYIKTRQMKKLWYRVMSFLAAVVVFCTTYALILPAVTASSKPLNGDYAHVTSFTISKYSTGTAPFDGNDEAGNDSTAENMIVRTFDTVTYTINVAYGVYEQGKNFTDARVKLEFVLPVDKRQAEFDLAAMGWLDQTAGYAPNVETKTLNGVECQVLTGYKHLFTNDNKDVVPGQFAENVIVNIKMMKNGDTIAPVFSAAMDYNTWGGPCADHNNQVEKKTVTADTIKVSAAPKYNVQIKQSSLTQASTTYDFSAGSDKALNTGAGKRTGRIVAMGVTLQLYNDNANKKLRGIEIPQGKITFDIKLSSKFQPVYSMEDNTTVNGTLTDVTGDYTPLVWSYGPQEDGINLDRDTSMTNYNYAVNAAPWNKSEDRDRGCYNGGTWTAEQDGATISFTVDNYDFDGVFPSTDVGESNNIYYNKQSGIQNIGCFSAAELYIVQPYTNASGKSVLEDFSKDGGHPQEEGTGICTDGTFFMTVKDVNLQATSINNQPLLPADNDNSNQGQKNDDNLNFQLAIKRPGNFEQRHLYSDRSYCGMLDIFGAWETWSGTCARNGDDWAVIGTDFRLTFGGFLTTNGDDANKICAAKWLLKFDPKAIELTPGTAASGDSQNNYSFDFRYAVKPDRTGWKNDAELKSTSMFDLNYYESIELAKAKGEIVGILVEAKPKTTIDAIPIYNLATYFSQNAKVKEDADLAGKRFIITEESMIWTVEDFNKAEQSIPSLLDNDPSNPTVLPDCTFYIKPEYGNGDGVYDHHTGTYTEGDTLLVLSYKPTIIKNVEQKLPNGIDKKTTYNLDAGQRVIDFVLRPGVNCDTSIPGNSQQTTVTIEDTLPKYLTYRSGSCYFGGEYTQTSDNGGTQGKITGGILREPDGVVNNPDGTQTLTWTITGVPVGPEMPLIHYSVNVGAEGDNDVPVGTTPLTNTAKISVEGSEQPHSVAYGNVAEVGVTLTRGSASAYGKYSKNTVVEPDGEINYVIFYNNNSNASVSDIVLLDTMPRDGYLNNAFTGSYSVTSWKLDPSKCTPSNFKLYYTTDADYAGKTFVADGESGDRITKLQIEGWQQVVINSDGTLANENTIIGKMPVAWALIGNLDSNQGAYVDLTIKLNPGEFNGNNNVYHNTFSNSANQTVTTTSEHSVVRTLEGLTWMDDNADGVQDSGESPISDVKVSLLKLREGTIFTTNSSGSWDAIIEFKLDKMLTEIGDAKNLKKIRFVASGIPVRQWPQLFYATSGGGGKWHDTSLESTTTAETEYVYDTSKFTDWSGSITYLRWDPVDLVHNQSFTLKSIIFDLADGSTREFDFTVERAFEQYLNLYNLNFAGYGNPANEADYDPYCYPGTSEPVTVETGEQISVLAQSSAVAYEEGHYKFNYLPAGIFAVKFEDGTRTISNYIASPANRGGISDALGSDGIATYSDDRSQLLKTVITGIKMPAAVDMNVAFYESKHHDSGFYERGYELPKSGGVGAEIYTVGGFLMFTSAAFVLLNKQKRCRKS